MVAEPPSASGSGAVWWQRRRALDAGPHAEPDAVQHGAAAPPKGAAAAGARGVWCRHGAV
eukprot:2402092-Prymnesium_polylepis.1